MIIDSCDLRLAVAVEVDWRFLVMDDPVLD
jgi:hypothetical protein